MSTYVVLMEKSWYSSHRVHLTGTAKKEKQSSTQGEVRATFLVSLQHHDSRRSSATDAEPKTREALRLYVVQ